MFVDSGAWIAYFSVRDARHAEADGRLRAAVGTRRILVTTNLILAEVHRWFLFQAGIAPAAAALGRIDATPLVKVVYAMRSITGRHGPGWRSSPTSASPTRTR